MVDWSVGGDVTGEKDEEDESVVDEGSESVEFSESTTLAAAPAALTTAQN